MNDKKIVRPVNGRKVSGVCLGVSNYLGIDVTVLRILWVLLTIFFFRHRADSLYCLYFHYPAGG